MRKFTFYFILHCTIFFICCFLFFTAVSAQTFVLAQLTGSPVNTSGWNLSGNAHLGNVTGTGNSEVILCTAQGNQSGAIFFGQPVNANLCKKWTVEFDFRIFDGNNADGLAFCYLDVPPAGFVPGGGLGIPGTANGVKVCFDVFPNCSGSSFADMPKIEIRWGQGYDECWAQPTLTNSTGNISFIRSANYAHAKVTYDDGTITAYLNNTMYLQGFQQLNFPGYMGFTSSTGGSFDTHSIKNAIIYTEMPPSVAGRDVTICRDGVTQLGAVSNSNYIYNWNPVTGLNNPTVSNPTVTLANNSSQPITQQYIVATSQSTIPGCTSSDTVLVTILPKTILTPDTVLCNTAPITLRGKEALAYQWAPSTGLSNSTVQNPIANISSSQTYQLTSSYYNNNLVVNGNFDEGNNGFFSSYTYCNSSNCLFPLADNGYAVGASATSFHSSFAGVDHTTGTGNFMMINGANPSLVVWRQTIPVAPNTTYAFGTWINTLISLNTASIQFSINGTALGAVFAAPAATNQWIRYFTEWNSGSNTSATIEIVDVFPQANGNDFGLDDIFFAPVITCSDTVRATILSTSFNPLQDTVKLCSGSTTLDAGTGFSIYNWSNGATTQRITVTQTGWYKVTATISGCTKTDSSFVQIFGNPQQISVAPVICPGQSFLLLSGIPVNATGIYKDSIKSFSGCDSIIRTINLSLLSPITKNINATICIGQTYSLQLGNSISIAGLYRDTIRSIGACDSIYIIAQLKVISPLTVLLQKNICLGQFYTLPSGNIVGVAGQYKDTLRSIQGCDSLYTLLNLSVSVPVTLVVSATICNGQTYLLPSGRLLQIAGVYNDTLKNIAGCDSSILQLTLTVAIAQVNTISRSICAGNSFVLPSGTAVQAAGNYADTIKNVIGCDSIITNLTLQLIQPTTERDTVYTCIGQSYMLPSGQVVNLAGTYISILISVAGCDSTITTVLLKYPSLQAVIAGNSTLCEGLPLTLTSTASGGNGGPYTYNWAGFNNNKDTLTFIPANNSIVMVQVSDGCTSLDATASVTLNVFPKPIIQYTIAPEAGCVPLEINILNNSSSPTGTSYNWHFGNGDSSLAFEPHYNYALTGTYKLSLKATTLNGCIDSVAYNRSIEVSDFPVASFIYSPFPNLIGNSNIHFIDSSTNAALWQWDFGDNSASTQQHPAHEYAAAGNYPVRLIVDNGKNCTDTAFSIIEVQELDDIYIPNAFSPDGDGTNDYFRIYGIGIQKAQMDIYNRYGELVFTTTNNPPIWNGINRKKNIICAAGNYVYFIRIVKYNGISKSYKGNILLIK